VPDPGLCNREVVVSHSGRRHTAQDYLRDTLVGPSIYTASYLYLFQRDQIMDIQRYISTVASLMKEILRNQNHADIRMMAASRKVFTYLLRKDVVKQIV